MMLFAALRNLVDYPMRQLLRWRRKGYQIKNEPKTALYAHLRGAEGRAAQTAAERLRREYHLDYLYAHSRAANYRENLFYLHMLETALAAVDARLPARIEAADIGPSHWFYVHALHAALRWQGSPSGRAVNLSGYEKDAYRVYADLHSRCDHAMAHIEGLDGVRYLPEGFREQPSAWDVLTMLFPFVFIKDHLEWGLPRADFAPQSLLAAAWRSLRPGGLLILANQGEAEHTAQRLMLEAVAAPPAAAIRFDSLLYDYDHPRFVLVCRQPGE
jgi:SAM-dependent methyltransferase